MISPAFRVALIPVCLLLLAGATLSCGMGSPLPEGAELIPGDSTFAISLDVPAILNSELYKRLSTDEGWFGQNRINFYRFAETTGIDPSSDIQRVLFMARADTEEGFEEMSAIVIGTFDGRKVRDFLAGSGLPFETVNGMDIFEMVVYDGRCAFCLAVVDSSTAAFGSGETLRKIAEVRGGTAEGLAEESRAGRLLRRVGRTPEAWGILRAEDLRNTVSDFLVRLTGDASALAALGPIMEVSFSFDAAEPMRLLVELSTMSESDALLIADVLRGAESLGRLALKEANPELGALMSDLSIEADTGVVRLSGTLPARDMQNLAEMLRSDFLPRALSFPPDGGAGSPSP